MSKKKVILSTIAILLVMFAAVSVVSYSIANLGHGDNIAENEMTNYAAAPTGDEYVTCIDLILENAEKGEKFNVVEIVPNGVATPTGLGNYSSSGYFAKNVLYAYKETYTGNFTEEQFKSMINYNILPVNSSTSLAQATADGATTTYQSILDAADLIYVSSPSYNSYTGDINNMSEEILNYLRLYISADKPIVMDYVTSTSTTETKKITYETFANAVRDNFIKYRTYGWKSSYTAEDFFVARKAYYLSYSVNNLADRAPGTVLVITAGSNTISSKMEGYADLIEYAYYGKDSKKPTKMTFTTLNVANTPLTVDELNKKYDFIVIEGDVKSIEMDSTVYAKLKALSESSKYIIYDESLISATDGTIEASINNYLKLLQLYVSDKGVSQRANVLPVSPGFFDSLYIQKEDGVEGAKPVADLLDGSDYRGSNTSGAASKKYRVLEIEPCYPIDLELARSSKTMTSVYDDITGAYYTIPDQVLSGVTSDEIEDGTEYYAFEISKAKIAYATGVPYDQIEVVQMSTNELISSKEVIAENYDFVYIGGDFSALTPFNIYNFDGSDGTDGNKDAAWRKGFTGFDMYTHTGYLAKYSEKPGASGTKMTYNRVGTGTNSVSFNGNDITVTKKNELIKYVEAGLPIIVDKQVVDAFEEAYDYDYDDKYGAKQPNRLKQLSLNNIDPDCNMYKFLAYVYNGVKDDEANNTNAFKNVGWGDIDSANDNVKVENILRVAQTDDDGNVVKDENGEIIYEEIIDRAFGDTIGPDVTVYNENTSEKIKLLKEDSNKRPSLVLSSQPKQYIETNATTKNVGSEVKFVAGVKTKNTDLSSFKLTLYVDEDGDGVFSDSEIKATSTCTNTKTGELSYSLENTFFGLISWKVKVESTDGKLSDVATGLSFFKPDETTKKEISVLQIMPVESIDDYLPEGVDPKDASEADWTTAQAAYQSKDYVGSGDYSLYFCTECQMSGKLLNNNVTLNYNDALQMHKMSFHDYQTIWNIKPEQYKGKTPVQLGKHEHDFGIVIYDSIGRVENWESNFADALTRGDDGTVGTGEYEFDLDIMTVPQLEKLCNDATKGIASCEELVLESGNKDLFCYTKDKTTGVETYKDPSNLCDACAEKYQESLLSSYTASLETLQKTYQYDKDNQAASHALNIAFFDMVDKLEQINGTLLYYDIIKAGIGTKDNPGDWIVNQEYYKFWEYFNDTISGTHTYMNGDGAASVAARDQLDKLAKLYNGYSAQYDEIIKMKETYKSVCYQYGDADNWLLNNYDVIVFGLANEFNNQDLNVESAQQIKSYIAQGGAVLNTHETLTTRENTSVNMSNILRESFGMDRFHVVDFNEATGVSVMHTKEQAKEQTILFGMTNNRNEATPFTFTNQDMTIYVPGAADEIDFKNAKVTYGDVHTNLDENVKITIQYDVEQVQFFYTNLYEQPEQGGLYKNDSMANNKTRTYEFPQQTENVSTVAKFDVGETNLTGTFDIGSGKLTLTPATSAVEEGKVSVELTVTDGANNVADGTVIQYSFRDAVQTATTAGGVVSFTLDLAQASTQGLLVAPTGVKYRQYITKDPTKYFWTERLKAASSMDYASIISSAGINDYVHYNAPLGLSDFYVAYDTISNNDASPFLYAYNEVSFYEKDNLETDGNNAEYKYGSRRAEIVNQGGVTMYPFSISDTMLISPTHPQTFALDIEDEDVAVWYTMAGTSVENTEFVNVTDDDARRTSSFYAASPKDGMNNYFLYSKDSVFFTGAGHQTVTGVGKDNNDERKLFINVIVNSAIRGKNPPALRLYNKCNKEDCEANDIACDCYVDPNEDTPDKVPANTLYYNDQIKMYQYDIEDDGSDVYPEFDFKVLAGSANLKDIQVFYDLDYEKLDEKTNLPNRSDVYTNDTNHHLITSFSPADNKDGVRIQLRKNELKDKLLLKKEYMEPYNNCTYIVVRAKDARGQSVSARIKINVIPYLFDLTDAGSKAVNSSFDSLLLDMSDRKFNI